VSVESVWVYQWDGAGYGEVAKLDLDVPEDDVWHLRIADIDSDGRGELYVSTDSGLFVFRAREGNRRPRSVRSRTSRRG
jgi:hypothetical protein